MSRTWSTLDRGPTRVIAHRGASGPLPEHTLAAYALAVEQGADLIEPDLVLTRDHHLMVRHDRGLRRSTDIASRPQFAGAAQSGDWPVEAFTRAELAPLRAIQPFVQRDRQFDGQYPLLEFSELLAWAEQQARSRGHAITLYPELKYPAAFAVAGLDPVSAFVAAVATSDPQHVRILLQCFEPEPLRRLHDALGLPAFLLLDQHADWRRAVREHGAWVAGFGVAKSLLFDPEGATSGLVHEAHADGLAIHAWTYRDDVLPAAVTRIEDELESAFELGVDAVFCDFPATALACRARWMQA
jgi:glycerophosphoryl diester phosphodiesterase